MRLLPLMMLVVLGCSGDPVLSGRLGPRKHGGLMFARTQQGVATHRLYRWVAPGPATAVDPPLGVQWPTSSSLDGEWLAWTDDGKTWVRFLRGTHMESLTPAGAIDAYPRISSDGRTIVTIRTRPTLPGGPIPLVTLVDVESGVESALSPSTGTGNSPALSPNNEMIVWRSYSRSNGLELMSLSGALIRKLEGSEPLGWASSPSFSPDGQRIVFLEGRDGGVSVTIMDLYGEVQARLESEGELIQPAWSPDGKKIAVCVDGDPHVGGNPYHVMVWDLTSDSKIAIPGDGGSDCYPVWSN